MPDFSSVPKEENELMIEEKEILISSQTMGIRPPTAKLSMSDILSRIEPSEVIPEEASEKECQDCIN
jgi:hypothetical protein